MGFRCPICSKPLLQSPNEGGGGKSMECVSGHNYAIAKEGHVNLTRSGRKAKKSGTSGDENG